MMKINNRLLLHANSKKRFYKFDLLKQNNNNNEFQPINLLKKNKNINSDELIFNKFHKIYQNFII